MITTLTLRTIAGRLLTNVEVDDNFIDLNEALDWAATGFYGATDPATLEAVELAIGYIWANPSTGWVQRCQQITPSVVWKKVARIWDAALPQVTVLPSVDLGSDVHLIGVGPHTWDTDHYEPLIEVLGTAATRDITTSATDTTPGRVLTVGYLGLGGNAPLLTVGTDLDTLVIPGSYTLAGTYPNSPLGAAATTTGAIEVIHRLYPGAGCVQIAYLGSLGFWMRQFSDGVVGTAWVQLYHSGNTGTAALANVTTSSSDTTAGRVLKVGDWGIGGSKPVINGIDLLADDKYYEYYATRAVNAPAGGATAGYVKKEARNSSYRKVTFTPYNGRGPWVNVCNNGVWAGWVELYHSGNTTVDGNGFIKSASPVIALYGDHIDASGFFGEAPAFDRLGVGVYQITGVSGLASKGWYITTPEDRNGNKYFNIEWEQDKTPEAPDGIVEAPENVVLTIRTYARVWNAQTGTHENGAPVDISERFVSLRFNAVRQASEEPQ